MAGLFDLAQARFGLENHESDFGQTLAIWGVGPVTVPDDPGARPVKSERPFRLRSGFGDGPAILGSLGLVGELSVQTGKYVNRTSLQIGEYEELKKASLDPYVAMRDAYIQYREHIWNSS